MKLKNLIALLAASLPFAANASISVEQHISDKVTNWFQVDVKQVKSLAVRSTFDCKFYSATPTIRLPDSESSFGEHLFIHQGDTVEAISTPSSTQPLPEIANCIKTSFRLTDDLQADVLREALDGIYKSFSYGHREVEPYAIKKEGHWIIINDKFFDDYSGYIVKTSPDGQVKSISYSLELQGIE
jgi:hypothetical protein